MAPNLDLNIININSLTVSGGLVQIGDGRRLTVEPGGITLSSGGQLFLDSTGPGSAILEGLSLSFSGDGVVTMSDQFNKNFIALSNSNSLTNGLTSTQGIQGAGVIGNNIVTIDNLGTINANDLNPLTIHAASMTNQGLLEANGGGGGLILGPFVVSNSGGFVEADNSTVRLRHTNIEGGTLNTSGSGAIEPDPGLASDNAYVTNLTNNGQLVVPGTTTLSIVGTLTNNGTVRLNGVDSTNIAVLHAGGSDLTGTGTVVLSNTSFNVVEGGGKFVNQQLIEGAGTIEPGSLQNEGTFLANGSFPLIIHVVNVNNTGGTLEATSGATLNLDTGTVTGGTVVGNAGTIRLIEQVTAKGAELATAGGGQIQCHICTLFGDHITGNVYVNDGDQATLKGTETVDGAINDTATTSSATTTISGNVLLKSTTPGLGTITMLGPKNIWSGATGSETLTNDVTIQGAGDLGNTFLNVINGGAGKIIANSSNPLDIELGAGNTFHNLGLVIVANIGELTIAGGNVQNFNATTGTLSGGRWNIAGALQFDNAKIVNNASTMIFSGQILDQNNVDAFQNNFASNTGIFTLMNPGTFGSIFNAFSPFTNSGTLTVQAGRRFTVGGATPTYNQTAGTTTDDGIIDVGSTGSVNVTGGVFAGRGSIVGNVTVGNPSGTLIAGDTVKRAGRLTISNDYTQLATGSLDIQIGGTSPVSQYSRLTATGPVTLGGTLNLALINGYLPPIGQTFTIITAPSHITGTFSTVNGTAIDSTRHLGVSYSSTAVVVTVVAGS